LACARRRRLEASLQGIRKAKERWVLLIREIDYSAVAREIGLTPEAVRKRVKRILGSP